MPRVDEQTVRRALAAVSPALRSELHSIAGSLRRFSEVKLAVFDVEAEAAFDRFPVVLSTYDAHGDEYEYCSLDGRALLVGQALLDRRHAYPLGRIDFAGHDTMSDLALVERLIVEELRAHWPKLEHIHAYAGRIQTSGDGWPDPSELVSLDDGARRVVTLRWP